MIECMRKKAKKPEFGKWIPTSERLPEDCDMRFYMCIVENHEEDVPMFCQYEEERGFGFWRDYYDGDTLGFIDSEFQTNEELGYEKVIAWMPLPESYSVDAEKPHIEKPQTNADRIRSMTDEELAKFLPTASNFICQPTEECIRNTITKHCGECAMKWLRAESEE